MNKIFIILKKELKRFFSDKRMLLSLILPGILIYIMYSLMGSFISNEKEIDKDEKFTVAIINKEQASSVIVVTEPYNIEIIEDKTADEAKTMIKDEKLDLLIVFEDDFDTKYISYQTDPEHNPIPYVYTYYNSVSKNSNAMNVYFSAQLDLQSSAPLFQFNDNDLASENDVSAMIVTTIAPFLLIMLLFSGSMSIATESIAGEKERGTIATLLVTQTKRRDIAIGKILALSITALFSSVISFAGLIGSLPKLMDMKDISIFGIYPAETYLAVLLIIMVTIIFFTVIMSLISINAKSVKEAGQYALPVMVAVMAFAMPAMFGANLQNNLLLYLVPVLNSINCLSSLFSMSYNVWGILITTVSNLAYISIGILLLIKMFNSERIMFNK